MEKNKTTKTLELWVESNGKRPESQVKAVSTSTGQLSSATAKTARISTAISSASSAFQVTRGTRLHRKTLVHVPACPFTNVTADKSHFIRLSFPSIKWNK